MRSEGKNASCVSLKLAEPLALNQKLELDKPDSGDACRSDAQFAKQTSVSQPSQLIVKS